MSRGLLSMFAGGDPWKVNATLQSGRPTRIGDLARAFHNAGQSTREADQAFTDARSRLEAWTRDNGQHPITNSPEVQQTITALGLQANQLPKIAVDLETIAAALAQTQGTATGYIDTLDARLQSLDDWIGQAEDLIKQDEQLLAQATDEDDVDDIEDDIDRLQQYITDCEHEAIEDTKATLRGLEQLRDQTPTASKGRSRPSAPTGSTRIRSMGWTAKRESPAISRHRDWKARSWPTSTMS